MANRDRISRVGVLGAGRHSVATHGPALQAIAARPGNSIELAAVCDIDRDKARQYADDFGFQKVYSSLGDMVKAEQLDALFLITPLALTEQIVTRALPLRIPLLIEKPPGTTPDETRRMLEVARREGTPHMISFNRRFNPALRRAMGWIAEDRGKRSPHTVIARMLRHNRREENFAVGTGIHLIDAVIALIGRPSSVSSHRSAIDEACRFFNARVEFGAGASANILIAPACGRHEETLEAHGEDFSFDIDFFANRFRVFREKGIVEEWTLPQTDHPKLADVLAETEHFLASLGQASIHPDLEDGLVSMLAARAIQEGGMLDTLS